MNRVVIDNVRDFDVRDTFECGQCFRWEAEEDGSYTGIAAGRIANISCRDGRLVLDNVSPQAYRDFWHDYLDLGRDYGKIRSYLASRDEVICRAMNYGSGIRILAQEEWETLVSFIVSANSNIPRIKKNIGMLAEMFGEPEGEYRGRMYYSLPDAEKMASLSLEDLAPVRLGYRAPYLIKTARMVVDDGGVIDGDDLEKYAGVGPKVAACVSLFGFHRIDSFPIDTWVKQVMNRLYGIEKSDTAAMRQLAEERFSPYGGIAQQYLFYYMRENSRS
ncbi:MAG: DNA-3-methyladenine glycosylase family protein [Anaerovoracaceae bacterium]|jgi:N-glycosylase/DNA lyase